MLNEGLTLTPFAMYASYSPGYSDTSTLAVGNTYTLGLRVTQDMSKNISLKLDTLYVTSNDSVVTSSIGDKTTSSTTAYSVGLSALIFF